MKKKEKRMILILILVSVLIIGILYLLTRPKKQESAPSTENTVKEEFVQVLEDGTKLNTSTKLNEMRSFEGLKIGNIQLTNKNGQTVLLADVRNEGTKDTDVMAVSIVLYNKEGKELVTINSIISPVKAGGSTQLNTGTTFDYANAYDFKIIKK